MLGKQSRLRRGNTRLWWLPKVGLSMNGRGKSGAVKVIYTAQLPNGVLIALLIYGKGATENIPAHVLRSIAKELNHGLD
ncbi:hypothetical protein V2K57_25700 [Pseudomonas alliivorans]|nr:hypothetical protein [Pseudomonas alliivorans]MEE4703812.1 hypothetical protein [Pseudomonas alliivorans]MEE4739786.1 hypothetical protein [Pseudomonas alliivorans]